MAIHFQIIRNGDLYSASADNGPPFEVGKRVSYGNKKTGQRTYGLANDSSAFARRFLYTAAAYSAAHPFWADFIEPTAICEGQSFITLNTYDRARFTFGFAQFAAHVPNGDFVLWFRDMLRLPDAANYFPDLEVSNGHICKVSNSQVTPFEDANSTTALQTYLNPTLDVVEDDEVVAAARFIYWTIQNADTRELQVNRMVSVARGLIRAADRRLGLNCKSALECCIIFDILHQGRAHYSDMEQALLKSDPVAALLEVGSISEPGRCANLKMALTPARRGVLNGRSWNSAAQDFN